MRIIITSVLCFLLTFCYAQIKQSKSEAAFRDIDNLDSIIIDFANGTLSGKRLAVPLYIKTDDNINALDFSFKFNESKLELDTIIKQGNIEMTYFFNLNDRKLRLTSYSVSDYNTDKKILTIYFNLLQDSIGNLDLNNVTGFLNGDACPIKITSKSFQISGTEDNVITNQVSIYPNPTHTFINVVNAENYKITICDLTGKSIQSIRALSSLEQLDISALIPGHYTLKFVTPNRKVFSKSFVKN